MLTGFMGAGKTTAGRLLAEALRIPFDDLDALVAEQHGMTVPAIFATEGEDVFRASEADCLENWLERTRGAAAVLALGGGAVETARVLDLLGGSPGLAVFHLDAPLGVLLQRCEAERPDRPLLRDAEARFARRANIYRRTGITIATGNRTPQQVAAAILAALEERP